MRTASRLSSWTEAPGSGADGAVRRFDEGEPRHVFLLSLKAGRHRPQFDGRGYGHPLRFLGGILPSSSKRWTAPTGSDRRGLYRLSASRPKGTIEDSMHALQQRKRGLIEEIVKPGAEPLSSLSDAELMELLALSSGS